MPAPATALVMHPYVREELLHDRHIARLDTLCSLASRSPFPSFDNAPQKTLAKTEILITSWGCPSIDRAVLNQLPKLKLIAHLAGSVKGFVDEYAWRRGVIVTNAVAANAVPVAEYTLAAILFANKRVFQLNRVYREVRENRSPWSREAPDVGNYGKTVGIVGASHIGRLVLRYLQQHDFKLLLYDPYVSPLDARDLGAAKVGLAELASQSDVVSLHAPLLPETRNIFGGRELGLMKDHATLINTARGALVDHAALTQELANGRIFAVLDTTDPEVPTPDSPLYELPNVFLTPHIAGSLGNETQRLAECILEEIGRFVKNVPLQHAVKREELDRLA